jgi:hypothetical protein
MRSASARFAARIVGSHRMITRVESWRGAQLVDGAIPFEDGEVTYDDTQAIPGDLSLTVPAGPNREWDPTGDPFHPLAPFGQRLYVSRGIVFSDGTEELVGVGWFLITDATPDPLGRGVAVKAASLERLLEDATLQNPLNPLPGGTFDSEARRLVGGRLPMIDLAASGLVDRAVPTDRVWEGDRLANLGQIATAWPARIVVDAQGLLAFRPPAASIGVSVADLHTGSQGVVASWQTGATRAEIYNAVFARGEVSSADAAPVSGLAWDSDPASPTLFGGAFGEHTLDYSSPLLTTVAECETAAATILAKRLRRNRVAVVEMVPDPRLEANDWVDVNTPTVVGLGRISGYKLPLTADAGTATLTVEMAS